MEYIEREAAIRHIKENKCSKCSDIGLCGNCAVLTSMKLFEEIPAADVVEVVRCGQCKYGKHTGIEWLCDKHSGHADRFGEDASYHEYHSKHWFCADGEKRSENG